MRLSLYSFGLFNIFAISASIFAIFLKFCLSSVFHTPMKSEHETGFTCSHVVEGKQVKCCHSDFGSCYILNPTNPVKRSCDLFVKICPAGNSHHVPLVTGW